MTARDITQLLVNPDEADDCEEMECTAFTAAVAGLRFPVVMADQISFATLDQIVNPGLIPITESLKWGQAFCQLRKRVQSIFAYTFGNATPTSRGWMYSADTIGPVCEKVTHVPSGITTGFDSWVSITRSPCNLPASPSRLVDELDTSASHQGNTIKGLSQREFAFGSSKREIKFSIV